MYGIIFRISGATDPTRLLITGRRSVLKTIKYTPLSTAPGFRIGNYYSESLANCRTLKWHSCDINSNAVLVAPSHRYLFTTTINFDKDAHKPSSKVEVTVQAIKKQQKEDSTKAAAVSSAAPSTASTTAPTVQETKIVKKTIKQKIVGEIMHYYHGFRLLFIDMKISSYLLWRILRGEALSRREYRLLIRTVGDMFRLVPFSVFIIVPFMEFLLPFFIKFFPGMLPSTFQTAKEKEDKIKQNLKVKMEMAKFLQETLDDMSVQHNERTSSSAKSFVEWFQKVRTSGEYVSSEDIMKYAKLFEDEITLDSLSRSQLIALCRVLDVQTLGTNNFLRFQLRMKLRSLAADDRMIQKEGVNALNLGEVQQACRARGMRAYGLTEERLRMQLSQWLDLSLNEKVPPSLLLLSRALMLPETIPTGDKLKATISALPETIVVQTKAAIGEKEGKIDNKAKLQALKQEEKQVKEERQEQLEAKKKQMEQDKKEVLIDRAPIISTSNVLVATQQQSKGGADSKKSDHLEQEHVEILESAIDTISKDKNLLVEKGELADLKAEMADYKEDVEDLQKVAEVDQKIVLKETKAAKRLYKSVNRMINKLDGVMTNLEEKEKELKLHLEKQDVTDEKQTKEELLKIDDIVAVIKGLKNVSDQNKIDYINKILMKMDDDHDGVIKIEDVLKVIEIIGKEQVHMNEKQLDELIDVIEKEDILQVEDKIEKALQKSKEPNADNETTKLSSNQNSDNDPIENTKSKQESSLDNDNIKSKLPPTPPPSMIPPPTIDNNTKPKGNSTSM